MIGIIRETAKNLQHVDVMVNLTSVGEDFLYQVTTVSSSKTKNSDTERYIEKLSRCPEDLGLSIPIMCKVFPFHIVIDHDMQIVQLGKGLLRIFKTQLNEGDRHFSSFFVIQSPKVAVTFEDISQLSNVSFVLVIKTQYGEKETLQVLCTYDNIFI
ncbi:guanylate cyclase [Caerostris darwini]|uniref:guanylate cyclase n=1 Tax=Caerostris darwini TaxID=1538125 RepID=A0AAV4MNS2_9ARAC|nr:guanylate cyclase [Caerostris darwini]